MAGLISRWLGAYWKNKGRRKRLQGERLGDSRLVAQGKRDELAGMLMIRYGYPLAHALAEADKDNV